MTGSPEHTSEIRAVLDRSALESYARGHVHVGEVINEITDEERENESETGVFVGIPACALFDAYLRAPNDSARALLAVVTSLSVATVLDLDRATAETAAASPSLTGADLARTHSVWATLKYGAVLLTAEPDLTPVIQQDQIIQIPLTDA